MKLYVYIFCLICCAFTVNSQTTEDDHLDIIQAHIDNHKPIDKIYTLLNNYYKSCEKGNCKHLDLVRFYELKYSWHKTNIKTFKSLVKQYKKNHPSSLYDTQINQLQSFNNKREQILSIFKDGLNDSKFKEGICTEYSSIGIFQQYCDYINTPFQVIITDTTFTEEDHIYQFKYTGHDYKAPVLKLLRGNGDGKINILSNDSSKGSIRVKNGAFQEISFVVSSNAEKKTSITFNSLFDTESQLNFEPQLNLDNGIFIMNIKDAETPITLQFTNTETYDEKEFVYSQTSELSAEPLSSLLDNGSYTLKIEDGNGNVSKIFNLDIRKKKTSIPWVPILSIVFFSTLFYHFFKWFKARKRPHSIVKVKPTHSIQEEVIKKEEIPVQADPIFQKDTSIEKIETIKPIVAIEEAQESDNLKSIVEERIKPKINVSGVTNTLTENSLSKEELNAIADSGEYISLSLNQLWADSLVKNVYLRKTMIHRMDLDVRNEENMKKEIGGFLLGKYYLKSSGMYDICLEEYVDIEGEGQSEFQIGFGADAWSKLEDSLQEFNHFDLIGWFHTHPGHGVFLSRPDKNISNNFFNKPYQVAMEIDPLLRDENPNLDTSFFTQKKNGDLNNNNDLVDDWHSWSDIVNKS